LQTEGLVQIHPRRGTYISRFSARDIRDCFELRMALEAQALRCAFEARNAGLAQEIIDLFVEMDGYFQSEREWLAQNPDYMRLDQAAHIKMVQFSSNSRLLQAYENANVQGYIAVMGSRFAYADVLKTKAEHLNILKALRARDLNKLLHTARLHLERAGERAVIRLTQEDDAS
jgi:DNA-binding GntR family transcriptional regulator